MEYQVVHGKYQNDVVNFYDTTSLTSDNLIIYGHHIKDGKMSGALESCKDKDFYEEHKTIPFDTLTETAEYAADRTRISQKHIISQ